MGKETYEKKTKKEKKDEKVINCYSLRREETTLLGRGSAYNYLTLKTKCTFFFSPLHLNLPHVSAPLFTFPQFFAPKPQQEFESSWGKEGTI